MTPSTTIPDWVARVTDDGLRYRVGEPTFARGLGYAREEMVGQVGVADRGRVLLGEVSGSRSVPYNSFVTLEDDGPEPVWSSRCSCPVGEQCKHAVALLLTFRAAAQERSGPAQVAWTDALGELLADEPPDDLGAPMGLVLEPVLTERSFVDSTPVDRIRLRPTRRTKIGGWAMNTSWNDVEAAYTPFARAVPSRGIRLQEAHRQALAQIVRTAGAARPWAGYSYTSPTIHLDDLGPQAWSVLARVLDAGVVLVGAKGATVTLEEPAEVHLDVTREEQGLRVQPAWSATAPTAGARLVPIGEPAHGMAVIADDALSLVPFTRPPEPSVADLLAGQVGVSVPDEEVDLFLGTYLPRLRRRITVVSGDGSVELPESAPPRLHVEVEPEGAKGVSLTFGFVYAVGRSEHIIPLRSPGGPVPRDLAAERRLTGIEPLEHLPGPLREKFIAFGSEAVRVVTEVLPELEDHPEVVLEIDEDLPSFEEVEGDPEIRIGAAGDSAGTDWLDLHVSVSVGQEEVPFEPLFEALVRGDEAMLLDSGVWFPLSHPSLQELRTLIEEARALSDARSGQLRLSRYQVGLWDELVGIAADVEQQDAWVRSVEALRTLDSLPSPAPPASLQATLRPYQLEGYHWLSALWDARLGGILADDMGLGKTVQVLALLARATEAGDLTEPALVVAPTSMVGTWASEAARFVPDLDVRTLPSTHRRRGEDVAAAVAGTDLVITSYAVLRIDATEFARVPWRAVFLDEAQAVKNSRAKTHLAVRDLRSPLTVAVTGTPLENSLMDLWSLLALAAPGLYPRRDRFTEVFRRPIESGEQPEVLDRLRRRIRPLMLRRSKEQVALDLPPKQIQVMPVDLAPGHRRLYDQHLQRERKRVLGLLEDPEANRVAILASLTRMRQLSLDPALIDPEGAGRPVSRKLDLLAEHLAEITGEGHRAIVFSQFTGFLRMVQERLTQEDISTCYLDGGTRDRARIIEDFRSGDAAAFLISLKAGGVGLTLTEADYVFILDPWWNPATEAQAIDRAHRIGQDKPVMVYRMVSTGTIEEKVVALQERKRDLFERVVDDGGALSGSISAEDIRALLDPA